MRVYQQALNINATLQIVRHIDIEECQKEKNDLFIIEDLEVNFYNFYNREAWKRLSNFFRLIKAISKQSDEKIYFVSNNFEFEPKDIADLYRQRW
jgi:hypothetical protein